MHSQKIEFKTVLADAQYDSSRVRETVRQYGAELIIPARRCSSIKNALILLCLEFEEWRDMVSNFFLHIPSWLNLRARAMF